MQKEHNPVLPYFVWGQSCRFMSQRFQFLLFCALLNVLSLSAQHVTVEASLDSTAILVGEQLQMHTKVSCPKDSKVQFPEFQDGYLIDGVEVQKSSSIDTAYLDGGKRWELSRSYTLTAFDSAVYTIPRFCVEVNGDSCLSRNEIGLKVNNVDVDLQHPDNLRPLKAPVDGLFAWSPRLLVWNVLVWICVVLFIWLYHRYVYFHPITRKVKIAPPIPPQKKALSAIEDLRSLAQEEGTQKEFFMRLSEVLRSYIAERFSFNALEMTTHEIVRQLRQSGSEEALQELTDLLSTADLVKFAKFKTSLVENDRSLLQAISYIRTTQTENPDAEKAIERVIIVEDKGQRRYKLLLKCGMVATAVFGVASFGYSSYLLWINFL